jgi:hypothetical protein
MQNLEVKFNPQPKKSTLLGNLILLVVIYLSKWHIMHQLIRGHMCVRVVLKHLLFLMQCS